MQLVPALRGFKEIAAQIAAAGAMISTSTGDPVSVAVFNFKSCFSGDPLIYKYKAADSLQNFNFPCRITGDYDVQLPALDTSDRTISAKHQHTALHYL